MKITHPSGQPYDLPEDFKIEITRSNPFFHKTGEQSLPCSLPPTDRNTSLLHQPANLANNKKLTSRLDVTIENGSFFTKARQAILSAQKNEPIATSFYLNEGAFYEKTKDLTLMEIFKDKTVEFNTVDDAITFMRSLLSQRDDRFTCFSVITDNNELNALYYGANPTFVNATERTVTINGKQVLIPKGMYITPFVKVRHILCEVVTYLGYTMGPSFLDQQPFNDMVFLNNNVDTLLTGSIAYVDIIPDLSVSEFFDIIRKFNCELIPDETNKILQPVLFNDVLESVPESDLSKKITGNIIISFHDNYKQLRLTSDRLNIPDGIKPFGSSIKRNIGVNSKNDVDTISELVAKFPTAQVNNINGSIFRIGFRGEYQITEFLGSMHCNYFDGDILTTEEKKFPDALVEIFMSNRMYPYVGTERALRSTIVFDDEQENESIELPDRKKLPAMLCFYFHDPERKYNIGTVYNRDLSGNILWNYSLAYNGEYGIFEKFWRKYDDMLRNALLEIRGNVLLSETDKMMLSSYRKIIIDGQEVLPSELKYIPGERIIQECTFVTTKLQQPVSHSRTQQDYFPVPSYKWILKKQRNFSVSPPQGGSESIRYKAEPLAFFPVNPTQSQYNAGGRYYEFTHQVEYGYVDSRGNYTKLGDGKITVWLEAVVA